MYCSAARYKRICATDGPVASKDQRAVFFRYQVCFLCNKPTIHLEAASFNGNFGHTCKQNFLYPSCLWGLPAKIKRYAAPRNPPPPRGQGEAQATGGQSLNRKAKLTNRGWKQSTVVRDQGRPRMLQHWTVPDATTAIHVADANARNRILRTTNHVRLRSTDCAIKVH